jgi:hypothetical protein
MVYNNLDNSWRLELRTNKATKWHIGNQYEFTSSEVMDAWSVYYYCSPHEFKHHWCNCSVRSPNLTVCENSDNYFMNRVLQRIHTHLRQWGHITSKLIKSKKTTTNSVNMPILTIGTAHLFFPWLFLNPIED